MAARILIADDNELGRIAIKFLLRERTDLEISAEAVDGTEAVEKAKNNCPDLAILDIEMPRMNGIEAARELIKYCPDTIVMTNSIHDGDLLKHQLTEAGVKAFVSKFNLASELLPTIDRVLKRK
jgi:DNA-binding NarL/FixJ family response regulator